MSATSPAAGAVLQAQGLGFRHPGTEVFAGLSFSIGPGLAWVRGGDGRGKSTLLRLMAGVLAPTAGTLRRATDSVWFEDATEAAANDTVAQAWLDARRARFPGWDRTVERHLVGAFGLGDHIAKPLYMLSTGSRRKVALVGAAACGARLTLVDMPFAALDAPSIRVLTALFAQAAEGDVRGWVVADHECPAALRERAMLIDLGG